MSNALARSENNPIARVGPEMDIVQMGKVFAESGFFKDSRSAAQAMVKIMAGKELGIPPVAAMTGIYIVKEKVMVGATVLASAVQRSGRFSYRVLRLDESGCRLEFFEQGKSVGFSEFTVKEATAAGLAGSQTYRSYPRNMYFSRALSNGVKWYCPGVLSGPVYTPEELGVPVNATGEPVVQDEDAKPATVRRRAADLLSDKPAESQPEQPPVVDEQPESPEATRPQCPSGFADGPAWRASMLDKHAEMNGCNRAASGEVLDRLIREKGPAATPAFDSYLNMNPGQRERFWNALVDGKFPKS